MEDTFLPVRFEDLTEADVKEHFRNCVSNLKPGYRVEFVLRDVGVVIPVVKTEYKTKPSTLDVLIRSGSIERDKLEEIRSSLSAAGHDLKVSATTRQKLLKRVVVSLKTDDPFIPVSGLNVIRAVATSLGLSWPCPLAIGYLSFSENRHLPGRLDFRSPARNAGYRFGFAVGKFLRKLIGY